VRRKVLASAAVIGLLAAPAGQACFLEMGVNAGFSTSDPLTIPVLVAARGAAEAERIDWFASTDEEAVRNAILFLSFLPRIAAKAPIARADGGVVFSVLQVQTGYWTRYRVAEDGGLTAEAHHAGPETGENVIAVSDSALIGVLRGSLDFDAAREMGLIRGRGAGIEAAMGTFREIVAMFEASSFGARIRSGPIPLLDRS
jgi:hypothetical protein